MNDRSHRRLLAALALSGCALASTLAGCEGDEAAVWISETVEDSQAADEALAAGDSERAVERLHALIDRPVPATVAVDDARVVHQDALDRWARIELEARELDRAEEVVNRGLALGDADDVFVANLYTTRAQILEADGRDREAARDYHRAVTILEAELTRALGEGP